MEPPEAAAAPTDALADDSTAAAIVQEIKHTRSCNKRAVCSCMLRVESAYFQKQLAEKALQRRRDGRKKLKIAARGRVTIRNLQDFAVEVKAMIAAFLAPVELAQLSMVNKRFRRDMERAAERGSLEFSTVVEQQQVQAFRKKEKHETWSRYLHLQQNCVVKMFVQYTGYKTGDMRAATPHWAFGFVNIDPKEPERTILPNAWAFHGYRPWQKKTGNGKNGEWLLQKKFAPDQAPKQFKQLVREWATTIQVGNVLAVSFCHPGTTELTWWEAQVWYIWRADLREEPAVVYDAENDLETTIAPSELGEYFQNHPRHVIDVCKTPRQVCTRCASRNLSFFNCHIKQGHPML